MVFEEELLRAELAPVVLLTSMNLVVIVLLISLEFLMY